jgi:hypothetical protein
MNDLAAEFKKGALGSLFLVLTSRCYGRQTPAQHYRFDNA